MFNYRPSYRKGDLVVRGQTNSQTQAHTAYLQKLVQSESPQKAEIQPKTAFNNSQSSSKSLGNNTYLLVGGLVLFGLAVLVIGYWLGKQKSKNKLYFDEN